MAEHNPDTERSETSEGQVAAEERPPDYELTPEKSEAARRAAEQHPLLQRALPSAPRSSEGRRKRAAERARRLAEQKADAMPAVEAVGEPRTTRVVQAEMREPSPRGGLRETLQQPYLLKLIVRRELAQMYSASVLGLMWSYVQPAIRFATYYFIFGVVLQMHKDVPFFAIHLFSGMVFVHYFTETFQGGTRSIWQNRALVQKMAMPREVFPVASMLVAIYHTLPQLGLLSIICFFLGWHIDPVGALSGVLGFAILAVYGMALALLFSAFNVFYRDFQNIVGTILQFMHFLVPMMYPITRVLGAAHSHPIIVQLYLANPLAEAVLLVQRLFWFGVTAHNHSHAATIVFPQHMVLNGFIMLGVGVVFLGFSQRVFSRLENRFPESL